LLQGSSGQDAKAGQIAFNPRTVMRWNQQFRSSEIFPHPFECQKQSKPIIFRIYQEAETIARHGIQKLLKKEALCCETAAAFFGGEFIDRVLAKEYKDDWLEIPEDTKEIARQDLLLECHLKSKRCTSTASNWLAYLGLKYGPFFWSYYTDGHERRPEQKKHRVQYAKYLCDKEIRKYKWVRLTQSQKEELDGLVDDPLERDPVRTFIDDHDTYIYEYHVTNHPRLIEFVNPDYREMHGGSLSLAIGDERPIIEIGQDEAVFSQYIYSALTWMEQGKSQVRPNSEGDAVMVHQCLCWAFYWMRCSHNGGTKRRSRSDQCHKEIRCHGRVQRY
jgi:hypothetical protein